MATKLTRPIHRETNKKFNKRNVIVTISPGTESRDDMIGMRLHGQRTQYVTTVASIYQMMALWHANKEKTAKAAARKSGTPWKQAKKDFARANKL